MQIQDLKRKLNRFVHILFPILITQISIFAISFFDTVMSGHAGARDLAGVAIGVSIWTPVFTGLNGILLALTPIIAQLYGGKQTGKVPFTVIQGVYLSVAIALVVIGVGGLLINPILDLMSLEPEVRRIAHDYLQVLAWGIIPLFVYTVFRCFIDALGKTKVSMLISLISLPLNVGLNYLFIFGKFGFPRLGGVGAGYASTLTYWGVAIIAAFVILRMRPFADFKIFDRWFKPSLSAWWEQLTIGVPIGFAIFFETSIFAAVTLFMSEFSTVTIAAHQAAINFASLLYMVPYSISMALTIAVGFEVGARRPWDAKEYSFLGIGVALAVALVNAIGLLFFSEQAAGMYTRDPEVLELAQQFLIYAIFFQLSDAIATPVQGALRGYKDVNSTFWIAFVSYWVLGLPIGILMAKYTSFGAFGYWIGLILGLAFGAVFISRRLLKVQRKFQVSSI